MKIIANLGKLDDQRTALIIDNKIFPFYIVNGWNGEMEGDNLWAWTVGYYDNVIEFAKAITNYSNDIGWSRLDEIASKAIDHIIETDVDDAEEFLRDELDLEEDEVEYFCISETMDEARGYDEDEEDEEDESDDTWNEPGCFIGICDYAGTDVEEDNEDDNTI